MEIWSSLTKETLTENSHTFICSTKMPMSESSVHSILECEHGKVRKCDPRITARLEHQKNGDLVYYIQKTSLATSLISHKFI